MNLLRALVDVTLGVQITMKRASGEPPVEHLDAADFDDSMQLFDFKARGFGIENDLPHQRLPPRQHTIDGDIRKLIHILILFVAGVAFDPMPLDVLQARDRIELLP